MLEMIKPQRPNSKQGFDHWKLVIGHFSSMPIPPLRNVRQYGQFGDSGRPSKNKVGRRKRLLKAGIMAFAFFLAGSFIVATALVAWANRNLPDPDRLSDRQVAQSTKIYDRTGTRLLYEVYQDEKRTLVELDQISDYAKKATIAIEDKHFYEHKGVRPLSILRAGVSNLLGRRSGAGGASTLTQQLIKVTMVGDERSYTRKIKEAILALRLEKKYSKDQILKLYLNEISYGSTNYGIEAASQTYFRKHAQDLNLVESATLAALPKAPSRYLNDLNKLRVRRDYILDVMLEQGYITEEEKQSAQNAPMRLASTAGILEAPHFVLYIKQLLADQFGEALVDSGGLKVITSLDYEKQKIAENAVKELGEKNVKEYNANNTALVSTDPRTGQILAMIGSRDFNNDDIDGKFNVAVLGKRQPGSSFKPFVYLAAFERGYTPDTVLYDTVTNFEQRAGASYTPHNFNLKEYGLVTMRKALQGSLNIPAVKTLYLVGVNEAIDFARRFGYTTFTGDYGLSLVLGGAEVNLLEHTNAFATLANNGVFHETVVILRVTNPQDEVIYEWRREDGTEAARSDLAAAITNVLSDNAARTYIFGARSNLVLPGRPAAVKTGTTNDNRDAWTLGYTPSLAAGVWVGNSNNSKMKGGGERVAGAIWNKFMREALKNTPAEQFPEPPANTADKPVLRGSDRGITLRINRLTGKIAVTTTPVELIVERVYLPPHDILHYVARSDPREPAPSNPVGDPQYESWEVGLREWSEREQTAGRQMSLEEPPTEYDSPQSAELTPVINIISPAEGSTLASRQISIELNATAPRGIAQVALYIDDRSIATLTGFPFNYSYYAQTMARGSHTLRAVAMDDMGNSAQASVSFALDADLDSPSVSWIDGNSIVLSAQSFPRAMYLSPFRWSDMRDIKIFLAVNSGSRRMIYTFTPDQEQLINQKLMFTWNNSPGAGNYNLIAVMTDKTGRVEERTLEARVDN